MEEKQTLLFHSATSEERKVEVKEAFTQPDMDMIYNMTYDESRSGDVELAAPPVTGLEVQVTITK